MDFKKPTNPFKTKKKNELHEYLLENYLFH